MKHLTQPEGRRGLKPPMCDGMVNLQRDPTRKTLQWVYATLVRRSRGWRLLGCRSGGYILLFRARVVMWRVMCHCLGDRGTRLWGRVSWTGDHSPGGATRGLWQCCLACGDWYGNLIPGKQWHSVAPEFSRLAFRDSRPPVQCRPL